MISLFNPTLSMQRKNLVTSLLRATAATTLLDMGCGDGPLLTHLLSSLRGQQGHVETLKTVVGVDISDKNLARISRILETGKCDYANPVEFRLFEGCAITCNFEPLQKTTWDVVTCIEVIEHLPSIADATTAISRVLNELTPKYLLVSTPNYDSNDVIKSLESRFYMDPSEAAQAFQGRLASNGRTLREEDHKFEFTRQEFRDWIDAVLALTGPQYRPEVTFIGNSLDERMGCGSCVEGATQVVVFELQSLRDCVPPVGCGRGPDLQLFQNVTIVKTA
jgi:SAM-dependent methyltransferase